MAAPDPTDEQRAIAGVLRDLAWTIHRRIPEDEGFHSLPTTELAVLKQVLEAPGTTVSELSRTLGLQQPNTSAAVRTLAERGLVTREPCPTDRRVVLLHPTAAALEEHQLVSAAWSGAIDEALARLAPEQLAALAAAKEALQALDRAAQARSATR